MKQFSLTTGLIVRDGNILMLKRAEGERYYPSRWEPVSGTIEPSETPEQTIIRESMEEAGLEVTIIRKGQPYSIVGSGAQWNVIPFLLKADTDKAIKISNEHSEYVWADPTTVLDKLDTVDGFENDLSLLN